MMNTYKARAYLIDGCDKDVNNIYPNTQWGVRTVKPETYFRAFKTNIIIEKPE